MLHYLAAIAIFKEETPYLREWVEYHSLLGVEHFYLLNNDGPEEAPRSGAALAPYVEAGLVTEIPFPAASASWHPYPQFQVDGYDLALDRARGRAEWVAVFDLDEVIVPADPAVTDLRAILPAYERPGCPGLHFYPHVFGDSGHDRRQPLQTEAYTRRAPDDSAAGGSAHVFLRPGLCRGYMDRPGGRPTVDETGAPFVKGKRAGPRGVVYYNHYAVRSREDWAAKVRRGTGLPAETWAHRHRLYNRNDVVDTRVHRFLPALKKRLGAT